WKLNNLKFIRVANIVDELCCFLDVDIDYFDDMLKEKYQDFVRVIECDMEETINLINANDELERYLNYQQFFDEDFDLYKWWQSSKTTFPGLANLASEDLLLVSNNGVQLDNLDKFENVYENDDMVDKFIFLHFNMKYLDL
ncbi:5991_t:CDS:2, partial [Racocetra fulgida]